MLSAFNLHAAYITTGCVWRDTPVWSCEWGPGLILSQPRPTLTLRGISKNREIQYSFQVYNSASVQRSLFNGR